MSGRPVGSGAAVVASGNVQVTGAGHQQRQAFSLLSSISSSSRCCASNTASLCCSACVAVELDENPLAVGCARPIGAGGTVDGITVAASWATALHEIIVLANVA